MAKKIDDTCQLTFPDMYYPCVWYMNLVRYPKFLPDANVTSLINSTFATTFKHYTFTPKVNYYQPEFIFLSLPALTALVLTVILFIIRCRRAHPPPGFAHLNHGFVGDSQGGPRDVRVFYRGSDVPVVEFKWIPWLMGYAWRYFRYQDHGSFLVLSETYSPSRLDDKPVYTVIERYYTVNRVTTIQALVELHLTQSRVEVIDTHLVNFILLHPEFSSTAAVLHNGTNVKSVIARICHKLTNDDDIINRLKRIYGDRAHEVIASSARHLLNYFSVKQFTDELTAPAGQYIIDADFRVGYTRQAHTDCTRIDSFQVSAWLLSLFFIMLVLDAWSVLSITRTAFSNLILMNARMVHIVQSLVQYLVIRVWYSLGLTGIFQWLSAEWLGAALMTTECYISRLALLAHTELNIESLMLILETCSAFSSANTTAF